MKFLGVALFCIFMSCSTTGDDATSSVESYGRKKDAGVDAPPPVDAPAQGTAGWVSCYSSGAPNAACNLTSNICCFDSYVSPNNGFCATSCLPDRGRLHCDGDNDCPTAEQCIGYAYHTCEEFPCDAIIINSQCSGQPEPGIINAGPWHFCQPGDGTCAAGQDCVLAEGSQAQLYGYSPKMYVCYPF